MLGLGKQVGRHEIGPRPAVGHHQHLGRPGRHVNGHPETLRQLFGRHHVSVARAEQLVHRRNAFRAEGHPGDGLDTSHAEYLLDPAQARRPQHRRIHPAVLAGRGAHHHLGAAGDRGRHRQHEHRGKERSTPARHVDPHAADRTRLLAAHHPLGALPTQRPGNLTQVKALDIFPCRADGLLERRGDQLLGAVEFLGGDRQIRHLHPVETLGVAAQGCIALRAYLVKYLPAHGLQGGGIRSGTCAQLLPAGFFRIENRFHGHQQYRLTGSFFRSARSGYLPHRPLSVFRSLPRTFPRSPPSGSTPNLFPARG